MKAIIFGLGNFGRSLAVKLTNLRHEVIGVDSQIDTVEDLKDHLTIAICMDSTDERAVSTLPLRDVDIAIVAIGENEGASILTTALLRKLKTKHIIGRAISPLHQTVLESMGVTEIIHPEEDSAERLAMKLNLHKMIDSFDLPGEYSIVEITVPDHFVGKSIAEIQPRQHYQVNIITIIRKAPKVNMIGTKHEVSEVVGVPEAHMVFQEKDILVVFGSNADIQKLAEE
ncbi:MAG: TrkA family potassium uptake protein [Saprospiraceae bacterium]|nr:TrkA family potassium uptake protein [Saprospiraceae bacterium]